MNTTMALADLAICAAYASVLLKLAFVASKKVTAIDFRKITGNMNSDELSMSCTLLMAFALFILCCGREHGIRAGKALSEAPSAFLDSLEIIARCATAFINISTSILLGVLLAFCNDIEILMKKVMEEHETKEETGVAEKAYKTLQKAAGEGAQSLQQVTVDSAKKQVEEALGAKKVGNRSVGLGTTGFDVILSAAKRF